MVLNKALTEFLLSILSAELNKKILKQEKNELERCRGRFVIGRVNELKALSGIWDEKQKSEACMY